MMVSSRARHLSPPSVSKPRKGGIRLRFYRRADRIALEASPDNDAPFLAEVAVASGRPPEAVGLGPWLLLGRDFLLPEPLLLELGRGQVAQRRVDPLPFVHVVQE